MALKDDLAALKRLTRARRSEQDMEMLVGALNDESDRSIALLCSALIEEATEELLLTRMVELNSDEKNGLFHGTSPLATLSARVNMLYALGIIGKDTRRNLTLARHVRNTFAHSRHQISFTTHEVGKVCERIQPEKQMKKPTSAVLEIKDARTRYILTMITIWQSLSSIPQSHSPTAPVLP